MKNKPTPDTLGNIADDLWDIRLRQPHINPFAYREAERLLLDAMGYVPHLDSPLPLEWSVRLRRILAQLLAAEPMAS